MRRMAQVEQFSQAANFLQPAVLSNYALRHLELGTDREKKHLAVSQENAGYTLPQKMRESDLQVTGL